MTLIDPDRQTLLKFVRGESTEAPTLRRSVAAAQVEDTGSRRLRFLISTASVDRMNDIIHQDGWDLKAYRRNPVVLLNHSHTELPIARTVEIGVTSRGLTAVAEFATADIHPLGEQVFRALKAGFLNATSVGFRPRNASFANDPARPYGIDFKEVELLEWSVVSVPANSEALISGRGAESLGESVELAQRCLELLKLRAS